MTPGSGGESEGQESGTALPPLHRRLAQRERGREREGERVQRMRERNSGGMNNYGEESENVCMRMCVYESKRETGHEVDMSR